MIIFGFELSHLPLFFVMPINRYGCILTVSCIIGISLFLSSCDSKEGQSEYLLKQYVQTADSLVMAGKGDSASKVLLKQRAQFKSDNPQLGAYYNYMSAHNQTINSSVMGLYADSALAIFENKDIIEKYPEDYFKALLAKGDASMVIKQYETALEYYDKAQKSLSNVNCDGGNLVSKIAGIYFNQQSYATAARYWVESYHQLQLCSKPTSPIKLFFLTQAALDNIGVSYQKVGMFDSAAYYYNVDLAYINKTEGLGAVDKKSMAAPRIVIYDNLGGLYFKQGNLPEAERYLLACIAIPIKDVEVCAYLHLPSLPNCIYKQSNTLRLKIILRKVATCLIFTARIIL